MLVRSLSPVDRVLPEVSSACSCSRVFRLTGHLENSEGGSTSRERSVLQLSYVRRSPALATAVRRPDVVTSAPDVGEGLALAVLLRLLSADVGGRGLLLRLLLGGVGRRRRLLLGLRLLLRLRLFHARLCGAC